MAPDRPCFTRAFTVGDNGFFNREPFLFLLGFLLIPLALLLISCAAQHNVYLKKDSLAGISKVAVLASVKAPEVSYAQNSPYAMLAVLFTPALVVAPLLDASHAAEIRDVNLSRIEDQVALSFLQPLRDARCFESIEFLKSGDMTARNPSALGYDAVIRLVVDEIMISRGQGDYVSLHIRAVGQMESLKSGKVLWDREELIKAPEPRTLEYYKSHGPNELAAIIEKGGRKLANDFIYLKHLD